MSTDQEQEEAGAGEEHSKKLTLDVKVEPRSACERHITVTIPRDDIERYFGNAFTEMMPKAAVPGFRAGRAPRKLVELRFRKELADQVKSSLLMDSLSQLSEEQKLTPISEPDFDPAAIAMPDDGPMTFEFDIEVRPEFDLPQWKGLTIERPVREFTEEDVNRQLERLLGEHGHLVPFEGAAGAGDYVVVNLTFRHGGEELSSSAEEVIRIRPVLSFRDCKIENFGKLMAGVKAGERRTTTTRLTDEAPNAALRGAEVTVELEVLEVKKLELPELSGDMLRQLGDFEDEAALRDTVRASLARRLEYHRQQRAREQVLAQLTVAADWDLPPGLLRRQARREFDRKILELRRSGFGDEEIRAYSNELMHNSQEATRRALKEHFILERIAEEEKVTDSPEDYNHEIQLIAMQSGESVRRVRSQLEKRNLMDVLRNQIVERKTLELIFQHATFKDVPYEVESTDAEAIELSAAGEEDVTAEAGSADAQA